MAARKVPSLLRSNIEIERKFNPGPKFAALISGYTFKNNSPGSSAFTMTVAKQPTMQLIHDTYYDAEDSHISELGLWVRKRHILVVPQQQQHFHMQPAQEAFEGQGQTAWNAKLRVGGHFTNSQFVEIDGKTNVSRELLRVTGPRKTRLEDLSVVADLRTRRSVWNVKRVALESNDEAGTAQDDNSAIMTIVVDDVTNADADVGSARSMSPFYHCIGEVELSQTVLTEDMDDVAHETYRKEVAAGRMEELEAFMRDHTHLFSTIPTPVGKLTAYYKWEATASQH